MIEVVFGLCFLSAFFVWIGYVGRTIPTKFGGFAVGLIEAVIIAFVVYAESVSADYSAVLIANFYSLLTIGFGVGMLSLFRLAVRLVRPDVDELEESGKWENDKWGLGR